MNKSKIIYSKTIIKKKWKSIRKMISQLITRTTNMITIINIIIKKKKMSNQSLQNILSALIKVPKVVKEAKNNQKYNKEIISIKITKNRLNNQT